MTELARGGAARVVPRNRGMQALLAWPTSSRGWRSGRRRCSRTRAGRPAGRCAQLAALPLMLLAAASASPPCAARARPPYRLPRTHRTAAYAAQPPRARPAEAARGVVLLAVALPAGLVPPERRLAGATVHRWCSPALRGLPAGRRGPWALHGRAAGAARHARPRTQRGRGAHLAGRAPRAPASPSAPSWPAGSRRERCAAPAASRLPRRRRCCRLACSVSGDRDLATPPRSRPPAGERRP